MSVVIKQLPPDALTRIGEIDRSEHITTGYVFKAGVLESQHVDWKVPRWSADPSVGFSVRARIEEWKPLLDAGGTLLGAMDVETLAGIAIIRPDLSEGVAQLAALYVDRSYRRRGIAGRLVVEVERLARRSGAEKLYVSAVPSGSAVGFYLAKGFVPTQDVDRRLFALEPDDIHMVKLL